MIDLVQYKVCQNRGHRPSMSSYTQGDKHFETCKYCGVTYWIETVVTVHEKDGPQADNGDMA